MVLIAIAACGDNAASREQGPPPRVVVRTDPASAADCPYGGSVVRSGLDEDRNGALDDAEIMTRTVLCNDPPVQPPPAIAVRLVAEPAGAHCALGGTAVESGPDRNGNGRLDDDEVAHVDYVCGEVLLTRLAAEAPGPGCAAGGVAFLAGRDRNHDGVLGDDEVEATELSCGTELLRDVVVQTAADAAALANITIIAGSLMIDGTELADLALPRLVEVGGGLEVAGDGALAHVAMPALQIVQGRLAVLHDGQLAAIELPQLHRVGSLVIDGDPALHDLSGLPALAEVAHDLQISNNDALVAADLPVTRIGGDLAIDGNAQLARASWTMTGVMGAVHIASNPQLASVDLGGVTGGITIASNDQLDHVSIGSLVIGGLAIDGNVSLTQVLLEPREITGDAVVRDNGSATVFFMGEIERPIVIDGSLTLSGSFGSIIVLSGELEIHGDYTIDATPLSVLSSNIASVQVGGTLHVTNNPGLEKVELSLIAGSYGDLLRGGLDVRNNGSLTELSIEPQTELGGDVTIADNPSLRAVPALASLVRIHGNVRIASDPALQSVFGPSLAQVDGELAFDSDASLADPGLAGLAHVGSLAVTDCGSLARLELPALSDVDQGIEVRGNAALAELQLPLLQRADLGIFDNPRLPACEVDALFAATLGDHHQSGNDSAAVCP